MSVPVFAVVAVGLALGWAYLGTSLAAWWWSGGWSRLQFTAVLYGMSLLVAAGALAGLDVALGPLPAVPRAQVLVGLGVLAGGAMLVFAPSPGGRLHPLDYAMDLPDLWVLPLLWVPAWGWACAMGVAGLALAGGGVQWLL